MRARNSPRLLTFLIAAFFLPFHLVHHQACAFFADFSRRAVPEGKIAFGIFAAAVEDPAFSRSAFQNIALSTLRAFHAR